MLRNTLKLVVVAASLAGVASACESSAANGTTKKNINQLEVGECFNEPKGSFLTVKIIDCTAEHNAQLVASIAYSDDLSDEDQRAQAIVDQCDDAATKAGVKLPGGHDVAVSYLASAKANWSKPTAVHCYIVDDTAKLTASVLPAR